MKQVLIPAAFNPAAGTVDFSNVSGFVPARLLAVVNASARAVLYDPTTQGLGIASISGSVLTLQANISAQGASDRVIAFYDDGTSAATAANQPSLNADGGALAHVTNFPASQAVSGAVSVTNFPSTQPVSWSGQTVGVSSLPSLPAGANTIGTVNVANFPSSQSVSDVQSAPFSGAVAMTAGTAYAAQRSLGVLCTSPGNLQMQLSDGSGLTLPVSAGWQTFPFAVVEIVAAGTTATASCFNLK